MNLKINLEDLITTVTLSGALDNDISQDALAQLRPLFKKHARLLVDLSAVTYVSSAGLRVLLVINRQMLANDGRAVFLGMSAQVKEIMEIIGFMKFLPTAENREGALHYLKGS